MTQWKWGTLLLGPAALVLLLCPEASGQESGGQPASPPAVAPPPSGAVPPGNQPSGSSAVVTPVAPAPTDPSPPVEPVRRDPAGKTGISPFWEKLQVGDRAFVARNFPAAESAFQAAIELEPQNPLGHYRMGQAQVAAGKLEEAETTYAAALRYAGADPALKAKILFVMADIRERRGDNSSAIEQWQAYDEYGKQHELKYYPDTAAERQRVNSTWQQLVAQYAEVKKRIEAREKEAAQKLDKSTR